MKTYINLKTMIGVLFLIVFAAPFVSCESDSDGRPEIYRVRTTNPELKDSTFVQASPGQMILIEGKNLGGTKKIFINDQNIAFNTNYVTSGTIILTVPAELVLTGTNPDLPKELRVETSGGVAVYSFHILSPAPVVNRIQIDYPVEAGDVITIHGENFYEIEKIVLHGETGTDVTLSQYLVGRAYNTILFNLPAGVEPNGELTVYCAAGEASYPYATIVQPPAIASVSSDMPVVGAEFFITGVYFIGVEKVNINGEFDILADDLRVSESNDTIYLKLPQEPAKSGNITVTAAGGDSNDKTTFYPVEYVIANYDDVGSISWAGSPFTGDGVNRPYVTTGVAGGVIESNVGEWNGWFGNLLTNIVFINTLEDSTPVSDIALRFECFMAYPMSTITFQVMFGGDWDNTYNDYVPRSRTSGKTETGQWMSCEVPLSFLVRSDITTYGDVRTMGGEIGFFSKNGSAMVPQYEFYCDNFRFMVKSAE